MKEPDSLEEQAAQENFVLTTDEEVFALLGIKPLGDEMKTAAQVADGFKREDRKRAHCLREKAYKEGFQSCLAIVGGMLTARDVDDPDLIQAISIWIKEMKENDHE